MVTSTRRMVGAVLALIGAIAVVWSAFIHWYAGRNGSDIRVRDLFNQMTTVKSDSLSSLFLPLGVAALVTLVGIALQSRWLWLLGGLIALATVGLWGLRQAQTVTGLHASLVGRGPGLAAAGGAVMLIAAAIGVGRQRSTAPAHARTPAAAAAAPDTEPAVTTEPVLTQDEWADSGQAYQQGYGHGLEQPADKTADTLHQGHTRDS